MMQPTQREGGRPARPAAFVGLLSSLFILFLAVSPVIGQAPPPTVGSTDELLFAVARQVPTFGGMFIGSDGKLAIYLVDARQAPAAKAAITSVFGRGRVDVTTARVLPANYTFAELRGWHNSHRLETLAIRGVVMTGIHKATNRLRIGIESAAVERAIGPVLARAGVPAGAVEIDVMEPIQLFDTLLDNHRPIVGGLDITPDGGGGGTLGFLAVRQGQAGFVTNSHVTNVPGGVEGTVMHQATISGDANRVGVEVADPLFLGGGSGCPSGRFCRWSDSAFIARNGGPLQTTPRTAGLLGHIAFPDNALNIVTELEIVENILTPIDGESVGKIGKTSGHTAGVITDTCVDINQLDNMIDTNRTLICQAIVQQDGPVFAGPGDSGSPVFDIAGVPTSDLMPGRLFGILWGGNSSTFSFSPLLNVQVEIGPLKTFPGDLGANSSPEVKIREPLSFSHVGVGGFNFVNFEADVVDYEGCCQSITWTSDKDGVIGHGPSLEFTFPTPGMRTITVQVTDDQGATASDSIQLSAGTSPPIVSIVAPTPLQTIYKGVTYVFAGTSLDPNEPGFSMGCQALTWTSTFPGDPFPATGCNPQITFPSTGQRTIKLSGTDSLGLTATAQITLSVVNPPATAAPLVTILNPINDAYLPAHTPVTLTGKAVNPANQDPLTYKWTLIDGSSQTVLGTGSVNSGNLISLSWKPSDDVPFHCGGDRVILKLEVTSPAAKTGSASVEVKIGYPTC